MPAYDRKLLDEVASSLYTRALLISVGYSVVGLIAGSLLFSYARGQMREPSMLGAGLGLFVGILLSSPRSQALKAQAQTLLCQAQIEENTRRLLEALGSRP